MEKMMSAFVYGTWKNVICKDQYDECIRKQKKKKEKL